MAISASPPKRPKRPKRPKGAFPHHVHLCMGRFCTNQRASLSPTLPVLLSPATLPVSGADDDALRSRCPVVRNQRPSTAQAGRLPHMPPAQKAGVGWMAMTGPRRRGQPMAPRRTPSAGAETLPVVVDLWCRLAVRRREDSLDDLMARHLSRRRPLVYVRLWPPELEVLLSLTSDQGHGAFAFLPVPANWRHQAPGCGRQSMEQEVARALLDMTDQMPSVGPFALSQNTAGSWFWGGPGRGMIEYVCANYTHSFLQEEFCSRGLALYLRGVPFPSALHPDMSRLHFPSSILIMRCSMDTIRGRVPPAGRRGVWLHVGDYVRGSSNQFSPGAPDA